MSKLTEQQIAYWNIVVAEYDGWQDRGDRTNYLVGIPEDVCRWVKYNNGETSFKHTSELNYHSDMNQLWEVLQKIRKDDMCFKFKGTKKGYRLYYGQLNELIDMRADVIDIFSALVELLNEYNKWKDEA